MGETQTKDKASSESHEFRAEVSKLLDLMINALYRDKEIFLRELISNASDACDKLRYAAITEPKLLGDDPELGVTIVLDKDKRTITVADNGIGMSHDELVENLGTIARSGTEAFLSQMTGDANKKDADKDVALIGQFGVGFYSAFMVANRVEVFTRRAGEDAGWRWESKGQGGFTIRPDASTTRGARIVIHLRKDENEFLEPERVRWVVKTYSDHVALPIRLQSDGGAGETLNQASALWTRPKSDISEEQYKEFYHHVSHLPGDPWLTIHLHAEGRIEYTGLLFVPDTPPFDLFDPARKHRVKLYVKRVFITDECEGLVPAYMRFMRGIVDSNDLPLNISRETLQHNPILAKIRAGLTKRIFSELEKRAKKAPEDHLMFWQNFGAVLKEGLYEDPEQSDVILKLARFRSTASDDGWHSLDDYVAGMAEGQDAIYYLSGDDAEALRRSPQLEGFRARGLEVLLMTDPVDQFWLPTIGAYQEKPFRSVTQGAADLAKFAAKEDGKTGDSIAEDTPAGEMDKLIALVKLTLGDEVKDVRTSDRLTDSPVCLVADEGDIDIHLERLMRQHQQSVPEQKRVLEINPRHALARNLAKMVSQQGASKTLEDASHLLLDQARILEGDPVPDPAAFTRRLSAVLARSLDGA